MIMKRVVIFALLVMLIGVVSAAECSIIDTLSESCDGTIIMGLSADTNAHGELYDQYIYDYALCCDFSGTHSCTGSNMILKLSDVRNAHAEIPYASSPTYSTNVCFGDLVCRGTTSDCTIPDEAEILSLSDDTNAHIGGPGDYATKICCKGIIVQPCEITSATWSTNSTYEDNVVSLDLTGQNCDGEDISFEIREDDDLGWIGASRDVINQPAGAVFSSNVATTTWTAEWHDDDGIIQSNPPEYFFRATVDSDPSISKTSSSQPWDELTVMTNSGPGGCSSVSICEDYTDPGTCESDGCGVADSINPGIGSCSDPGINCFCSWDNTNGCSSNWEVNDCGNGVIDPGETCDGGEMGLFTDCSDFGFNPGALSCGSDCHYDTSSCTGGGGPGGICGDGTINIGETCDSSIGSFGCEDFDSFEPGGSLICNPISCHFDTFGCTGGHITPNQGSCNFAQSITDNCNESGQISISWIANLIWDVTNPGWGTQLECINNGGSSSTCILFDDTLTDANFDGLWHYDPLYKNVNAMFTGCRNGGESRECPAQVQLPFFSWETLLVTLIVIGVIYWVWDSKGRGKSKRKSKKKSKSRKRK